MLNSFIQTQNCTENDPYQIRRNSLIILINPFKWSYKEGISY